MDPHELLSLIDSLDLTEEHIDKLLAKIMTRNTFAVKHMENALRFLKYKLALNENESLSCNNEREFEFVGKLIRDMNPENAVLICEITNIVLQLDPQSIVSKSEHLLQQLLSEIELPTFQIVCEPCEDETPKTLLLLKLISSILEAVITLEQKVSLPFLQVPLENLVFSPNDKIINFFYTSTIPKFKTCVIGFSILDRLWACLKSAKEFKLVTLKAVSSLADHYLPVPEENEKGKATRCEYSIAGDLEFWETALFGLQSNDNTVRKRATYLIKRALESLTGSQKDININTEDVVMVWDQKNESMLKSMWDNFFILMDSLEEMQSNIVLPSLKLFESVKHLGHCWLSCAYNKGLRHDNASVRLNCIKYRLQVKVESKAEAIALLNALNDIDLFENPLDSANLKSNISEALYDMQSMINILEAVPSVKWSPVPLFYITQTLSEVVFPGLLLKVDHRMLCGFLNDILRIPCNNPVIKKVIFSHIALFVVNTCKGFTWDDYTYVYPVLHMEIPITSYIMTPLAAHIRKNLYLTETDKNGFADVMTTSCENINIGLLYVSSHELDGIPYFVSIINEKVNKITDICSRPYANKALCLADVNFLIKLYSCTVGRVEPHMNFLNTAVLQHCKVILLYLSNILSSTISTDEEAIISFYDTLNTMPITDISAKDTLLELYTSSVLLLQDRATPMFKKTAAISIMNYLLNINLFTENYQNEMLKLEQFLAVVKDIGKDMNMQGSGKLKNIFYEKACDIVLTHLKEEPRGSDVIEIFAFVEDVLECGGYGCLKFVLRIINKILPKLIDNEKVTFDFSLFLNQMWMQICELKTNKEYVVCVDDYMKLITQDQLLRHPQHNVVVVGHYNTVINLAARKRMPLYFLLKHLSDRDVMKYDNMIDVLCTISLHTVVPKKDQWITDNLTLELYSKIQGLVNADTYVFNQHIEFLSIKLLSKVTSVVHLNEISLRIMSEAEQLVQAKPKYYVNNTTHRKLMRAFQTLLFIFLKTRQVEIKNIAIWCMNMLRNPHSPTIKILIYWYIALYIYSSDVTIDGDLIDCLSQNGVPLMSQLNIIFFVIRHKLMVGIYYPCEIEFVLDFLLSHTMGPVFSIRLTAQFYTMVLFETGLTGKKVDIGKYRCLISILSKTLGDLSTADDNSYKNLKTDYFSQTFDIVGDLSLLFIFHKLQRHCEMCTENVDSPFVAKVFEEIEETLATGDHDAFFVEWKGMHRWHAFSYYQGLPKDVAEEQEELITIQKKYVPWKNMPRMDVDSFRENVRNMTEMIVVASLVSRAPNLGGLVRTCEVFGVKTYVIDSLRHVQDRQFQSLSVSADRWVDIDEVPSRSLKEYLASKKKEGYCLVAAEQTSNSRDLTEFRFPKKTLLVLGHEKEGIPPTLLPLMDWCVEVPQCGVIRSMNVHVTAAVFMWEYCRQLNMARNVHEKEGIPPTLLPLMDWCVEVPQCGVIRSMNVHVTAAVFMWEYCRQLNMARNVSFFK